MKTLRYVHFIPLLFVIGQIAVSTIPGNVSANQAKPGNSQISFVHFYLTDKLDSLVTVSSFLQQKESIETIIPFEKEEIYTDDLFRGEEEIVQSGENGLKIDQYTVYYWQDEEITRELDSTKQTEPITQIRRVGTKKNIRILNTLDGQFRYYDEYSMYSTSYDANCPGCIGRTYLGTEVTHGVCAVDPKVIPLRSLLYVVGYGPCKAEDIGGAIKGYKIDLGFDDAGEACWGGKTVNVYLLEP